MPKIRGGPVGPDGLGGAYPNTDSDDQAAVWAALGGKPGMLMGGEVFAYAGQMAVGVSGPFHALVPMRSAAGAILGDRGYLAWNDIGMQVPVNAASAQSRNDALVVAVADTSAPGGSFGTGVSQAGPQLLAVPGVSGTVTPRTDAQIQAFVGAGGWYRLADILIPAGSTQVSSANITTPADQYGWKTLALNSPWTVLDPCQYRIDTAGNVHLRGRAAPGGAAAGSTLATLPAGYRPSLTRSGCATIGQAYAAASLDIAATGTILANFQGTPTWVSLHVAPFPIV